MFYVKSTLTGQIYKMEEMPKFGGFELSTEEEFNAYYISRGIDPTKI